MKFIPKSKIKVSTAYNMYEIDAGDTELTGAVYVTKLKRTSEGTNISLLDGGCLTTWDEWDEWDWEFRVYQD